MSSPLANQKPVRRRKKRVASNSGDLPSSRPRWRWAGVLVLLIVGAAFAVATVMPGVDSASSNPSAAELEGTVAHSGSMESAALRAPVLPRFTVYEHELEAGETIHDALVAAGLSDLEIVGVIGAAKAHQDLSRVRPGFELEVWKESGSVRSLQFALSPARTLLVRPGEAPHTFAAEVHEIPYEVELATFQGDVDSSLWVSATDAGMDPNLIAELTDVFAWQIDFSREVYAGDEWRLVVEQRTLAGKPAGWGQILAAEYVNNGHPYTAVYFQPDDKPVGSYYAPNGDSLRRMFLKSPVKFSRISSRFSRNRYHPVLKVRRPHYGVDYAAAPGTPIMAVGDGKIEYVGTNGGSGKFIKIRHNSTYQTSYSHLRGYAKGMKKGKRVTQGEVIGYVGSTGLATGPHLHFAFYENGHYVDPLSRKFPSADPVPKAHRAAFKEVADTALAQLPDWERSDELALEH